ncbi:MAG: hypothetical protein WAL98_12540 [Desulfatiglandaceae bacterium]
MISTPIPDFLAILRTLTEYKVDFIIVGGVCAVLHGAPVSTFDLDLVHSRDPGNIDGLMSALQSLDAYFRGQGSRIIRPTPRHLSSPGHQLLLTRAGPLDLLGMIGKGRDYKKLLKSSVEVHLSENLKVRTLRLGTLIDIKEETARDRDKAMLPILRRTLEEKSKM